VQGHARKLQYSFGLSAEFGLLTVVPFFLFLSPEVRRSPGALFTAAAMYVAGVVLNRCAVFFIAYQPPYAEKTYIPAAGEFALTIGLVATLIFCYRVAVTLFPLLQGPEHSNTVNQKGKP
jgi:Ni/Fe-hydrogenase subunit HybB-like protein